MVPILAAGLPITDTFVTMFRRVLNRRGIFSADRGHLHHVLLDAGISHRKVVVGLYIFSCLLGSIALIIVFKRRLDVGIVLFLASAVGSIVWSVSVRKQLARIWVRVSKFE
jgi:UDP-GlcNAc:undecaprenyl-phosphate GlcNAc-1-phosphate transferase